MHKRKLNLEPWIVFSKKFCAKLSTLLKYPLFMKFCNRFKVFLHLIFCDKIFKNFSWQILFQTRIKFPWIIHFDFINFLFNFNKIFCNPKLELTYKLLPLSLES